eukprot:909304-Pleurochrysis_carterae.AAC.1
MLSSATVTPYQQLASGDHAATLHAARALNTRAADALPAILQCGCSPQTLAAQQSYVALHHRLLRTLSPSRQYPRLPPADARLGKVSSAV